MGQKDYIGIIRVFTAVGAAVVLILLAQGILAIANPSAQASARSGISVNSEQNTLPPARPSTQAGVSITKSATIHFDHLLGSDELWSPLKVRHIEKEIESTKLNHDGFTEKAF